MTNQEERNHDSSEAVIRVETIENENIEEDPGERFLTCLFSTLGVLLCPICMFCCFTQIDQTERGVLFRLGKLKSREPIQPGLRYIVPLIDEVRKVDTRSTSRDIRPQAIITTDMVSLHVDGLVVLQIVDPILSITRVQDVMVDLSNLVQTEMRNLLGTQTMGQILSSKASLSMKLMDKLREFGRGWGVELQRIEIQNIVLPEEMKRSMAAEAEANREARAKILAAEGEQKSAEMMSQAAQILGNNPGAITLRYLQTLQSISNDGKASTIICPVPLDLINMFKAADSLN